MTVNEDFLLQQASMNDGNSRMEAFFEAIYHEVNSDNEPWSKKGKSIALALEMDSAEDMLISICGWSSTSLAKKAMLICDEYKEFHDGPVSGVLSVEYISGRIHEYECSIDPATHKVTPYTIDDSDKVENPQYVKNVKVSFAPVNDVCWFDCVAESKVEDKNMQFWYEEA